LVQHTSQRLRPNDQPTPDVQPADQLTLQHPKAASHCRSWACISASSRARPRTACAWRAGACALSPIPDAAVCHVQVPCALHLPLPCLTWLPLSLSLCLATVTQAAEAVRPRANHLQSCQAGEERFRARPQRAGRRGHALLSSSTSPAEHSRQCGCGELAAHHPAVPCPPQLCLRASLHLLPTPYLLLCLLPPSGRITGSA
jgi:hypothetical protein